MKKLLIILLLFGCGKDKEVIPECGVDEIYTEDLGCHLPTPCERLKINEYRDNGQWGCFVTYIIKPYQEIDKGCIALIDHHKKVDSVQCNQIVGYGHKWSTNQSCNCP